MTRPALMALLLVACSEEMEPRCEGECGTPGCGLCPEVEMIDAGDFRIDAFETTRAEYEEFAKSRPRGAGEPGCFADDPNWAWPLAEPEVVRPDLPVTFVIWCQAFAYCRWASKRLCGRVGGGAVDEDRWNLDGEWYLACSAGGTMTFPYGDVLDLTACNVGDDVVRPGTFSRCEGGFPGLFDMVGNVNEWIDARHSSEEAYSVGTEGCSSGGFGYVNSTGPLDGIRCCAD